MNTKLLAAAVIALVPLAGIAAEGGKTQPATPAGQSGSFDTLDANKDGRISMPEASVDPKLVETFSTADKNGDGYLDNEEFDSRTKPTGTVVRRRRYPARGRDVARGSLFLPLAYIRRTARRGGLAGHG